MYDTSTCKVKTKNDKKKKKKVISTVVLYRYHNQHVYTNWFFSDLSNVNFGNITLKNKRDGRHFFFLFFIWFMMSIFFWRSPRHSGHSQIVWKIHDLHQQCQQSLYHRKPVNNKDKILIYFYYLIRFMLFNNVWII